MPALCYNQLFARCQGGCQLAHQPTSAHLKPGSNLAEILESCADFGAHCEARLMGNCNDDDCESNHDLVDALKGPVRGALKNRNSSPQGGNSSALVVAQANTLALAPAMATEVALSLAAAAHGNETNLLKMQLEMERFKSSVSETGHAKELAMHQQMEALKLNTTTQVHSLEISNIQQIGTLKDEFHDKEVTNVSERLKSEVKQAEAMGDLKAKVAKAEATAEAAAKAPIGLGWGFGGAWGWGYNGYPGGCPPKYCQHGSLWSHCYTGPPRYCRHGNTSGTCCSNWY